MYLHFKIHISFLLVILMTTSANAQFSTKVTLSGISDNALKARIENNSSSFLTEINGAFSKKQKPKINNQIITDEAAKSLLFMWEMSPFRSYETDLIENIVGKPSGGFEIRNIPVFLPNAAKDNQYQEIALVINKQGLIDNIYFTLESMRYNELLSSGNDVTELRRRKIILDFVENFKTSYNRKDISYLATVFSEDALIVTGKVVKVAEKDASNQFLSKEAIIYQKQTKAEYLSRLKTIFEKNSYINVKFEEIEIKRHALYSSIYGVQMFQEWNTSKYSDAGFILLVVDFSNEDLPQIHVRTWQPENFNGKRLKDEEKFNLDQFNIAR
jgi:hypothetical protein